MQRTSQTSILLRARGNPVKWKRTALISLTAHMTATIVTSLLVDITSSMNIFAVIDVYVRHQALMNIIGADSAVQATILVAI